MANLVSTLNDSDLTLEEATAVVGHAVREAGRLGITVSQAAGSAHERAAQDDPAILVAVADVRDVVLEAGLLVVWRGFDPFRSRTVDHDEIMGPVLVDHSSWTSAKLGVCER